MPKVSAKENKNVYFQRREELGLTREKAAELLESIPADRIEKIENERVEPHPDEILIMADKYKAPELCNYYCAKQCPIGMQYVPEVKVNNLSQIVLKMLASLNAVQKKQERFIEITEDEKIDEDELEDFIDIQYELEKMSIAVETLQLWSERMLANGSIDMEKYEELKRKRENQ
jgi:transcriptional regulator with XRE-family HTH domain